jgi:hypothetical protein
MAHDPALRYLPDTANPGDPLNLYSASTIGNCRDFADLLLLLSRSSGALSATQGTVKVFGYGNSATSMLDYYTQNYGAGISLVSMRLSCAKSLMFEKNPHFPWHAGVEAGSSLWWDAVYGVKGMPSATEHFPSASLVVSNTVPSFVYHGSFTGCSHVSQAGDP